LGALLYKIQTQLLTWLPDLYRKESGNQVAGKRKFHGCSGSFVGKAGKKQVVGGW